MVLVCPVCRVGIYLGKEGKVTSWEHGVFLRDHDRCTVGGGEYHFDRMPLFDVPRGWAIINLSPVERLALAGKENR